MGEPFSSDFDSNTTEYRLKLEETNAMLEESNAELEEINAMLEEEITKRQKAEEEIKRLNEKLESKVIEVYISRICINDYF